MRKEYYRRPPVRKKQGFFRHYPDWRKRPSPNRGSGFDEIAERIYKFEEVKAVYLMSGGFDFTVILEEKTMKEIAQFVSSKLSTLDSILNTATHFVLNKYKDYGMILEQKQKDEMMLVTP